MIRGEDHVSNTPKHILLFEALGEPLPVFGHLPLILNADGTKMSKRKSQTAVADYIAQGFVREALVNYFAFLGWSPGTEEDVLSARRDRSAGSSSSKVQKGGARFDRERLEWLNGQWIRRLEDDDLVGRLLPFLEAAARQRHDRPDPRRGRAAGAPADRPRAAADAGGDRGPGRLPVGRRAGAWTRPWSCPSAGTRRRPREALAAARERLAAHDTVTWEADELEPPLRELVEARGWKAGDLFMAIRVATTGRTATPPLFDTLVALGRDRTLARIDAAIGQLGAPAGA